MSDDEPNDDQLERDPSYGIDRSGPVGRHGPRLATAPDERTVNIAEMRGELDAMREQPRERRDERAKPMRALRRDDPPMPARESVRMRLGPMREPAPRQLPSEVEVWDKAYDTALPLVVGLGYSAVEATDLAAQFADLKLEERRRRFGP